MKELSLFSGAGGGLLASKYFLGWETVGYVENNEYCQKVIAQRIEDGLLDEAPIFTDIRSFNRDGFANSYQGVVDVISGGFPCQDISCAGKGAGITGKRSGMWFEMETAIRTIRPRYVFIENSPMLLIRGFDRVLCGLSEMGYDARWGIISAADVGAPHLRKRIWIVGHSRCVRRNERRKNNQKNDRPELATDGQHAREMAHANGKWELQPERFEQGKRGRAGDERISGETSCESNVAHAGCGIEGERGVTDKMFDERDSEEGPANKARGSGNVANARGGRFSEQGKGEDELQGGTEVVGGSKDVADTNGIGEKRGKPKHGKGGRVEQNDWWESEPAVGRVANELAHRLD